jgi:hypothetical protein
MKRKAQPKMVHINTVHKLDTLVVYQMYNTVPTSSNCLTMTIPKQSSLRIRLPQAPKNIILSITCISHTLHNKLQTFVLLLPPGLSCCFFFAGAPLHTYTLKYIYNKAVSSVDLAQYDRRAHLCIIFNLRSTPLYLVRLTEGGHFRHNDKTYPHKLKSLGNKM